MESLGALEGGQVEKDRPDDDGDGLSEPETAVDAEVNVADRVVVHSLVAAAAVVAGENIDLETKPSLDQKMTQRGLGSGDLAVD